MGLGSTTNLEEINTKLNAIINILTLMSSGNRPMAELNELTKPFVSPESMKPINTFRFVSGSQLRRTLEKADRKKHEALPKVNP